MKIYIRAMSEELQKIRYELSHASDQLNMHLLKVILYPDSDSYNHWKGEIYGFLHKVDRVKGKNKWPKEQQLRQWISTHNDMIPQYVSLVVDEESELTPRNVSISVLESCIEQYDQWIAHELAQEGIARKSDVYDKVDELVESTF